MVSTSWHCSVVTCFVKATFIVLLQGFHDSPAKEVAPFDVLMNNLFFCHSWIRTGAWNCKNSSQYVFLMAQEPVKIYPLTSSYIQSVEKLWGNFLFPLFRTLTVTRTNSFLKYLFLNLRNKMSSQVCMALRGTGFSCYCQGWTERNRHKF